jgi:hypothetical protein
MERAPLEKVEAVYRTISSESAAKIEEEVTSAIDDGYAFAGLYGDVVVMEKIGATRGGESQESP